MNPDILQYRKSYLLPLLRIGKQNVCSAKSLIYLSNHF